MRRSDASPLTLQVRTDGPAFGAGAGFLRSGRWWQQTERTPGSVFLAGLETTSAACLPTRRRVRLSGVGLSTEMKGMCFFAFLRSLANAGLAVNDSNAIVSAEMAGVSSGTRLSSAMTTIL